MVQTRYRILSAKGVAPEVWEPYDVLKAAQHSSWVSTFRMNIAAEELQSARKYDGDTRGPAARVRAAAEGGRRAKRDVVKAEAVSRLTAKRQALCVARGAGESVQSAQGVLFLWSVSVQYHHYISYQCSPVETCHKINHNIKIYTNGHSPPRI